MELPKRKQIRLQNYNYSQNGLYFITICTQYHAQVFWKPQADIGLLCGKSSEEYRMPCDYKSQERVLSEYGKIVENEINHIDNIYDGCVAVDKYVIMPNHIHIIIKLDKNISGSCFSENWRPKVAPTISRIVQQFKGAVTKKVGFPIWQKSFYDHIIRSEKEYLMIIKYINENPEKWEQDCYYDKEVQK